MSDRGNKRLFPPLPVRLAGLEELAENLWWSWHSAARMVYKCLDRQAWMGQGDERGDQGRNIQ